MIMKAVETYLSVRRAAGFELEVPEYLLRSFARFASEHGQTHVTTRTTIDWASLAPTISQKAHRYNTVLRFARHAQLEDSQHEVPPKGIFGNQKKRRSPFIFTQNELDNLLLAACRLHPIDSIRPHTYSTLFALLACTGLRISEALNLMLDDITLDGLVIRDTKFKKSRLVPLHKTAQIGIAKYLEHRNNFPTDERHIFLSIYSSALTRSAVQWTFRKIIKTIGLEPEPGGGRRPRIHSLRHSFACRAIATYQKEHENIDRQMVALSTYMGHTNISDTYWYLESTPELMHNISTKCEIFWQGD